MSMYIIFRHKHVNFVQFPFFTQDELDTASTAGSIKAASQVRPTPEDMTPRQPVARELTVEDDGLKDMLEQVDRLNKHEHVTDCPNDQTVVGKDLADAEQDAKTMQTGREGRTTTPVTLATGMTPEVDSRNEQPTTEKSLETDKEDTMKQLSSLVENEHREDNSSTAVSSHDKTNSSSQLELTSDPPVSAAAARSYATTDPDTTPRLHQLDNAPPTSVHKVNDSSKSVTSTANEKASSVASQNLPTIGTSEPVPTRPYRPGDELFSVSTSPPAAVDASDAIRNFKTKVRRMSNNNSAASSAGEESPRSGAQSPEFMTVVDEMGVKDVSVTKQTRATQSASDGASKPRRSVPEVRDLSEKEECIGHKEKMTNKATVVFGNSTTSPNGLSSDMRVATANATSDQHLEVIGPAGNISNKSSIEEENRDINKADLALKDTQTSNVNSNGTLAASGKDTTGSKKLTTNGVATETIRSAKAAGSDFRKVHTSQTNDDSICAEIGLSPPLSIRNVEIHNQRLEIESTSTSQASRTTKAISPESLSSVTKMLNGSATAVIPLSEATLEKNESIDFAKEEKLADIKNSSVDNGQPDANSRKLTVSTATGRAPEFAKSSPKVTSSADDVMPIAGSPPSSSKLTIYSTIDSFPKDASSKLINVKSGSPPQIQNAVSTEFPIVPPRRSPPIASGSPSPPRGSPPKLVDTINLSPSSATPPKNSDSNRSDIASTDSSLTPSVASDGGSVANGIVGSGHPRKESDKSTLSTITSTNLTSTSPGTYRKIYDCDRDTSVPKTVNADRAESSVKESRATGSGSFR